MEIQHRRDRDGLRALKIWNSKIAFAQDHSMRETRGINGLSMLLRYMAYPMLLIVTILVVFTGIHSEFDFGYLSFLFLIGTIIYLAILERLIPFDANWHPSRREWGRDGIYFLLTMIAGSSAAGAVMAIASVVSPQRTALPLWLEIPLTLIVGSLASYLLHRLEHIHPWLWRVHGVHHVPQKVNVANNSFNHPLDVFCHQFVNHLPSIFLGFSETSIFAATIFTISQGYFVHANVDIRIGWFNYILASPEQHRLHHSTDLKEAGHYGADLALWDLMFRSFSWYPHRRPAEVGIQDPSSFPEVSSIIANLLHPWRRPKIHAGQYLASR